MGNLKTLLLIALLFSSIKIFSQEDNPSKFKMIFNYGFGLGKIENNVEPDYNINSNSIELLFSYNAFKYVGFTTGIGYNKLSGNGFNMNGNFFHQQSAITIPLLYTLKSNLPNNSIMVFSTGICALNVFNDDYIYLNNTQKDIYKDWSYGFQVGLSLYHNISQTLSIGIAYNSLSDFSAIASKNQQVVNQQKIANINSVGISILHNL